MTGVGIGIRGLVVRHGPIVALDGIDLDVGPGEVVAVIGPSGSGKSTLLRAVAGLAPITDGTITADGVDLAPVPTHRRDVGLMFQDHALFPNRTVADNVAFGLEMRRMPTRRRAERVAEVLGVVGLGSFGSRPVTALSGGEAQRVALARALAPEPSLLMLDEPFGSLDRLLRQELTAELRRLLSELGQTAIHVTHDQPEAFALADRVAVLHAGRLEQIGRPEELWRAPASEFVADFVGHRTIWTVEVDGAPPADDGGRVVRAGGVAVGATARLAPGRHRVVVPVTAISAADGGSTSTSTGPGVEVEVVACVFDDGRYLIDGVLVADGPERLTLTLVARSRSAPGARLSVGIDGDQLHPLPAVDAP